MSWSRVQIRESVGAVFSGSFTAAVFALPVVAILLPARVALTDLVIDAARAPRFVTIAAELDAIEGEAPAPRRAVGTPPAPEPVAPAEPLDEAPLPDDAQADPGLARDAVADASTLPAGDPEPTAGPESAAAEVVAAVDLGVAGEVGAAAGPQRDGASDGENRVAALVKAARFGGSRRGRKARCKKADPHIEPAVEATTVNRSLVEYYTSSWGRLTSLGWSGKYNEDGEKGWKISGFGCNSPLYLAGFRRGDVIVSVNGKSTKNVLQVFTTYRKLKRYDAFEVVLLRKGEQVSMHYRLRDGPPYTG